MNKTIAIICPVSNRAWILSHFLDHVSKINYPKSLISLYFIVNNSTDESLKILQEFRNKNQTRYNSISIEIYKSNYKFKDDRTFQTRNKYTYNHLSDIRNHGLAHARKLDVDYLLSIDSDILAPPDLLKKLLSANKPIVSSLIYNGYHVSPHEPWRYTNIMNINPDNKIEHISNWYVKNAALLEDSKIIPVDVTGAVSLISREVINSGAQYAYHVQGEDISFSIDAKVKGFQSYCDLSCFSKHIMSEEILKHYLSEQNKGEI